MIFLLVFAGQIGRRFETIEACIEFVWKTPNVQWHVLIPKTTKKEEEHRLALLMHVCLGLHQSSVYNKDGYICYS